MADHRDELVFVRLCLDQLLLHLGQRLRLIQQVLNVRAIELLIAGDEKGHRQQHADVHATDPRRHAGRQQLCVHQAQHFSGREPHDASH